ncbi:uncharacterized protein LOC135202253 isoform X3 [Macrobrachium nipponense]|uniref:uncharacterized protein LOC135202253 isoform X3 n=1 Tax=Macrobrachium nipponense TaxID=159736 RepID=UPI0030C89A0B
MSCLDAQAASRPPPPPPPPPPGQVVVVWQTRFVRPGGLLSLLLGLGCLFADSHRQNNIYIPCLAEGHHYFSQPKERKWQFVEFLRTSRIAPSEKSCFATDWCSFGS